MRAIHRMVDGDAELQQRVVQIGADEGTWQVAM